MGQKDYSWVEDLLNARVLRGELVQELWSGYGELVRLYFDNGTSLILKDIAFPNNGDHPRGWTTNRSDLRKRKSYNVELSWYQGLAKELADQTKIPKLLGFKRGDECWVLLLN